MNALCFYHRLFCIVVTHLSKDCWSKPIRAIICCTQMMICMSCVGLNFVFGLPALPLAFVTMRILQPLIYLVKPHKSNELLRYFTVIMLLLANVICQAIVYIVLQEYPQTAQLAVLGVVLELVVWDVVLQPVVLIGVARVSKAGKNLLVELQW